jgi:heptosyltransferase III
MFPLYTAERYVLIRAGALGDALLAFPALALLRRAHPASPITFVARPDVLPLAGSSGLADAVASYDDPAWSALFAEAPEPASVASEIVAGAAVIAWLTDPDGTVHHNLEQFGARQVVVVPSRPANGSGIHAALHLARTLQPLGVAVPDTLDKLAAALPPLTPSPDDEHAAEFEWSVLGLPPDARVVALHAGSGGAAKRWPPEAFGALAARLRNIGLRPLLIEGPQDAAVTHEVLRQWAGDAPIAAAREQSISTLAALLRRGAAYVGNDSGVTHLAALAGVPTLALFAPSDPTLWAPLGRRTAFLRSATGAMADLSVAEVLAALQTLLGAR